MPTSLPIPSTVKQASYTPIILEYNPSQENPSIKAPTLTFFSSSQSPYSDLLSLGSLFGESFTTHRLPSPVSLATPCKPNPPDLLILLHPARRIDLQQGGVRHSTLFIRSILGKTIRVEHVWYVPFSNRGLGRAGILFPGSGKLK